MSEVVTVLNQHEALSIAWWLVVWVCIAYLVALGAVAFIRPSFVSRFFDGFAASWGANALEAALRLVAGLALMGASQAMKLSVTFFWFGAILAVTAVPMFFLHGLHRRYAGWAIPFAKRILPFFGAVALALAGVLAWAII